MNYDREEKDLLIKDLCARLPYGVKIQVYYEEMSGSGYFDETVWVVDNDEPFHVNDRWIENIKPYLRPMSSMTEEERNFVNTEFFHNSDNFQIDDVGEMYTESQPFESIYTLSLKIQSKYFDWLNKKHFDYRGLINMGLAIEAPEGMYNTK